MAIPAIAPGDMEEEEDDDDPREPEAALSVVPAFDISVSICVTA
jgi:hypothetical protein